MCFMIFDIVQSFKQCGSGYINIVQFLFTKSYACFAHFAYYNKPTLWVFEKLI